MDIQKYLTKYGAVKVILVTVALAILLAVGVLNYDQVINIVKGF